MIHLVHLTARHRKIFVSFFSDLFVHRSHPLIFIHVLFFPCRHARILFSFKHVLDCPRFEGIIQGRGFTYTSDYYEYLRRLMENKAFELLMEEFEYFLENIQTV